MSYDIYLRGPLVTTTCRCPHCDHEHEAGTRVEHFWANHTSNTSPMWRKAGVNLADWAYERSESGGPASTLGPLVEKAIENMKSDPDTYKAVNPENGWGSYESCLGFLSEIAQACREYPDAQVYVSN